MIRKLFVTKNPQIQPFTGKIVLMNSMRPLPLNLFCEFVLCWYFIEYLRESRRQLTRRRDALRCMIVGKSVSYIFIVIICQRSCLGQGVISFTILIRCDNSIILGNGVRHTSIFLIQYRSHERKVI